MREIEFNGKVYEFPDNFTDAQIATMLKGDAGSAAPPGNVINRAMSGMLLGTAQTPTRTQLAVRGLAVVPPALGVTGGIIGSPGGPLGAAAGGGLGYALGRGVERAGLQAMGMQQPQSLSEQFIPALAQAPPAVRGAADITEQGLLGALLEGVPAKLFGIPGGSQGSIQSGLGKAVNKAESKIAKKALEKERARAASAQMTDAERAAVEAERVGMAGERTKARLAARDIGPEVAAASKATKGARSAAGAAKAEAVRETSEQGVEVSLDEIAERVMEKQEELFGQSAKPARLLKQIRAELARVIDRYTAGAIRLPRGASKVVDSKGRPIPAPPVRFTVAQADEVKKALGERLATQFAGIERGKTPKGGLTNMVSRELKSLLEEKVPDLAALNKRASGAIRESQQVEQLAARQPGPAVSRIRETQATRTAEASARQGIRQRPVEEGVRRAQREREAVQTALSNFREQPFWDPHLYLSGGLRMTTPRIDLMEHGLQRLLEKPGAAQAFRYTPETLSALIRAIGAQAQPDQTMFNDGSMPPDTLDNERR